MALVLPDASEPMKSQFFLLWKAFHNAKNFLFIGHPDAGQRSAVIYSIVVSCQRHRVNPFDYLRDVLTRLPKMTNQDDISALAPSKWSLPTT
ncbi:transposase domain-containing protein [Cerasicoccus frondis]|uniref:transposase domain-containing protein n=1 Tax=Cerasicoccus frondis TaxID=490090 RepID=UPI002852A260|nr:transposase domain-containing protein [Cerasicoccus frondis]